MIYIVCIADLLQAFSCPRRVGKSMRWWEYRRSIRLQREAEKIREGLLQELFTIRRNLELSSLGEGTMSPDQQAWLNQIHQLQYTLEQLSYQLAPPYVEESLPLAIQYLLEQWQADNLHLNFQTHLLSHGLNHSPEANQVIVLLLNEFLQVAIPRDQDSGVIEVCLEMESDQSHLKVILNYPNEQLPAEISRSIDLQHFKRVFQSLTAGQCRYHHQGSTLVLHCCWSVH